MKNIAIAAVAASIISTSAIAAPEPVTFTGHATTGAECSAQFDDLGGINVKELSERRQCLAVVHGIDTMFTYKTFWVRNGNTFTAFDVETLAKMTRAERIDYIALSVKQGLTIELLESELAASQKRVADLTLELGMAIVEASKVPGLEAKVLKLTDDLRLEKERVDSYTVVINEVEYAISSNRTISIAVGASQAELDAEYQRGRDSVDATHNVTVTGYKGYNGGRVLVNINRDITADDVINISSQLGQAFTAGINITQDSLKDDLVSTFGLTFTNADGDPVSADLVGLPAVIDAIETKINEAQLMTINAQDIINSAKASARQSFDESNGVVTVTIERNGAALTTSGFKDDADTALEIVNNSVATDVPNAPASGYSAIGGSTYGFSDGWNSTTGTITVTVADKTISFDRSHTSGNIAYSVRDQLVAFAEAEYNKGHAAGFAVGFADGFEAGYDRGFEDGYESGYSDGYADGFTDGVNSVN